MSATPTSHEETQGPRATYVTIWLVLAFLTLVEIFVPLVYASEYDQQLKMLLLCGLAAGKAILVAQFFMHLNHETAWVKFIASIPIYMGLFAIILMCESIYRQVGA